MKIIFDAKEGNEGAVTEWLQDYCENVNPELTGTTRDEFVTIFDNLRRVYALVGGVLSFILGIIGILNFVNVTITSILSRKRELAMMEAIGMSPRQQKRMLQLEGINYAVLSLLTTCTLGMGAGYIIANLVAGQMPIFTWRFTMFPILTCAPFLVIIAAAVPVISYKQACKSTVVERLRVEE